MTSVLDGGRSMSAITIQAMADMGYTVDVSEAESYNVPRSRRQGDGRRKGAALLPGHSAAARVVDSVI